MTRPISLGHSIAAIRMRANEPLAWIDCSCEVRVEAPVLPRGVVDRMAELERAWTAHKGRGSHFSNPRTGSGGWTFGNNRR